MWLGNSVPKRCLEITAVTLETLHSKERGFDRTELLRLGTFDVQGKDKPLMKGLVQPKLFAGFYHLGVPRFQRLGNGNSLQPEKGWRAGKGHLESKRSPNLCIISGSTALKSIRTFIILSPEPRFQHTPNDPQAFLYSPLFLGKVFSKIFLRNIKRIFKVTRSTSYFLTYRLFQSKWANSWSHHWNFHAPLPFTGCGESLEHCGGGLLRATKGRI